MSSTSERSSEEMLRCCMCLQVFSEPVSTPCGHNFCKHCISEAWAPKGPWTCPLCKEIFYSRPQLRVNTLLRELLSEAKLDKKKSRPMDEMMIFSEVQCDDCSEPKLKALKSCLVCLSSFCETHLQPHLTVSGLKRHQLMEPVENLEDRMCPKHQRPLELFCGTDQSCICTLCVLEHKNHELLSLEEACERRRSSLPHTLAQSQHMVEQRRLKIQEIHRCVELSDTEVHRERAVGLQAFTDLIQSVQRRQDRFLEELQQKQSRSLKRAQELVQQLEQEICELEKSSTEAERLSRSLDPLHFLQRCPALTPPIELKEWSSVNFEPEMCEGSAGRALSKLEKHLSEDFNKLFKQLPSESNKAELKRVQQFVVDVTLDPDTAHNRLVLSEDLKQVHDTDVRKKLLDSPLRFDGCVFVLGKQSFSSGRFYFEVQVEGKSDWTLGVAHESINRKGMITVRPKNGFWCIMLRNKEEYIARTDSLVPMSLQRAPKKVGVFVDYGEGLVSFFDADSADLLFSFSGCCFRDNLCPFFSPDLNHRGLNSAPLVLTAVETFRGQSD
ncbi:E3 ubiquitin-protein ligase TRIM21-like [Eucyclogobius newberryi]|uniref:E3 ubiquitin-protein ligase TRIM21-like n=1 Tax=Eucyclogobius newberryi TaxID=166745 RepID=UPI003B5C9FFE